MEPGLGDKCKTIGSETKSNVLQNRPLIHFSEKVNCWEAKCLTTYISAFLFLSLLMLIMKLHEIKNNCLPLKEGNILSDLPCRTFSWYLAWEFLASLPIASISSNTWIYMDLSYLRVCLELSPFGTTLLYTLYIKRDLMTWKPLEHFCSVWKAIKQWKLFTPAKEIWGRSSN